MAKKTTEYKTGDKFFIEDPTVKAQVIDMAIRLSGFRDTIAHLSGLVGLVQNDMWAKITEVYPDLMAKWEIKLHNRTGEIEVRHRK